MWENLRKKIVAILNANTLIKAVYDYEPGEFAGDPIATVTPSSNEGDYRTTTANRRIYAFNLTLWVQRGGEHRDDAKTEDVLTDLVDAVIDDFDKFYTLGTGSPGDALALKSGYTMVRVEAMPSAWVYLGREMHYRGAQINLRVHMDVDVTLIS